MPRWAASKKPANAFRKVWIPGSTVDKAKSCVNAIPMMICTLRAEAALSYVELGLSLLQRTTASSGEVQWVDHLFDSRCRSSSTRCRQQNSTRHWTRFVRHVPLVLRHSYPSNIAIGCLCFSTFPFGQRDDSPFETILDNNSSASTSHNVVLSFVRRLLSAYFYSARRNNTFYVFLCSAYNQRRSSLFSSIKSNPIVSRPSASRAMMSVAFLDG